MIQKFKYGGELLSNMILDDTVLEFEEREEHEAFKVILTNAALHLRFHDSFPKDVLMMGDNWYILAPIQYSTQKMSNIREPIKNNYFTGKRYHRIPHIIGKLKNDIKGEELALLLFSEGRVFEADILWPDKERFAGWYIVNYDNKKISVFPYARKTFEINPIKVSTNMPHE